MTQSEFDQDYYENGIITGKSCYMNYRWMPELTIKMAHHIVKHLHLDEDDKILDYGCAKGYLVKAFRILEVPACGCDISDYAIGSVDTDVRNFCRLIEDSNNPFPFEDKFTWIMSKDVLEHMSEEEIDTFLKQAYLKADKMFHVVPLGDGQKFTVPEYELDKTHKMAQTKDWWLNKFENAGWKLDLFSFDLKGIKDNWTEKYPKGNGFYILKKGC
jgi:cyclopropane fatty-acyl-phospholipid synthase-like methyltransferase